MEITDELVNKLKGKGFILNRDRKTFSLRIVTGNGVVTSEKMAVIADAAKKYGNGKTGLTSRLGFEIMGVLPENVEAIEEYLTENGIELGGTGPKVRPVVACKGSICKFGLHDTHGLALAIHEKFYKGWHDVTLPAKFKIGIGGCPNNCIKPQLNDFAVMGYKKEEKGLKIFIGGKYGRTWRQGLELPGLYSQADVPVILEKALNYYKDNGQPKERFGDLIERVGFDTVVKALIG